MCHLCGRFKENINVMQLRLVIAFVLIDIRLLTPSSLVLGLRNFCICIMNFI